MSRRLQLLFFIQVILLAGCRHEDTQPELLDPIYTDLSNTEKDDGTALEAEKKKLVTATAAEEISLPLTIDLNNARRDKVRAQDTIQKLEQKQLFDHIRTQRRLAEDHLSYHRAFIADKSWPPKDEYSQYLVNRRLNLAPKDWGAHLPKLADKKRAVASDKKKKSGEE